MRKRIDPRLVKLRAYINSNGVRLESVAREIGVTGRTIAYWMERPTCRVSPLASRPLDDFLAGISQ
jgi:hypothetical protein